MVDVPLKNLHVVETADPTSLPFNFPGREFLQLPRIDGKRRLEVNAGNVSVYASVKDISLIGAVRLNLFSELFGERQHVASAFVTPGQGNPLVMSVSGFLADSWHLFGQSTQRRLTVHAGLASQPCCAEPRVRIHKDHINPPAVIGDFGPAGTAQFITPPMSPVEREYGAHEFFVSSGDGTFTFGPGARITHMQANATGGPSTITVRDENGAVINTFTVTNGAGLVDFFPNGDLRAGSLDFANMAYISVEAVR